MQAFHNDNAVKEKYLSRVIAHREADRIRKGATGTHGKGCAVACTLDMVYDHSRYPVELGIPEWLAHVEDTLFEGMSLEKSRTWPEEFLKAIPVGADLEKVKGPFLVMALESTLKTFDHEKNPDVKSAIEGSIALWQREDIGSDEWYEAAAEVAARAAEVAARAAEAAEAAAWAAGAAAWAAGAAAWAAWAAYDDFADELLKILRECE